MRQARHLATRALGRVGGLCLAAVLATSETLLGAAAIFGHFNDHPFLLLTLPVALGAVVFGSRGAFPLAGSAALLAGSWWLLEGEPGGITWIAVRTSVYLVTAAVLGWAIDSHTKLLRRLSHYNEFSLDLLATASYGGYFTHVNPAFTHTLGFSAEELTERPLLEFVHPDDRDATVAAIIEQTKQGLSVFHFRNRYLTKEGGYRWLEWTSLPDPASRELIAAARDITERKRFEEIEHEHLQQLEDVVRERTRELLARNEELDATRREMLRRLALAAEYRDDGTHEHTERIGKAAELIARELGLPAADLDLIREAASLHDVGKLGVSDGVLLKPGKLTAAEFEHIKQHAVIGAAILSGSPSPVLQMAEEIARAHHEWWNGSGYPYGLVGEQIPQSARIVAVADVFDALTHERPYKHAWPIDRAIAEITRLSGSQFDPQVVTAFARLDHLDVSAGAPARLASVA